MTKKSGIIEEDFLMVVYKLIVDLETAHRITNSKRNYYERVESDDLLREIYVQIEKTCCEDKTHLSVNPCFESAKKSLEDLSDRCFQFCDPEKAVKRAISLIRLNRNLNALVKTIQ